VDSHVLADGVSELEETTARGGSHPPQLNVYGFVRRAPVGTGIQY
jgi:hypothetical protein